MKTPVDTSHVRAMLDSASERPWTMQPRSDSPHGYDVELGFDVDGVPDAERGRFANRADAELIAAAPKLLEDLLQENSELADANKQLSDKVEELMVYVRAMQRVKADCDADNQVLHDALRLVAAHIGERDTLLTTGSQAPQIKQLQLGRSQARTELLEALQHKPGPICGTLDHTGGSWRLCVFEQGHSLPCFRPEDNDNEH